MFSEPQFPWNQLRRLKRGTVVIAAVLTIGGCGGHDTGPVVNTPLGDVQGTLEETVHVFRDLPYAQPPVGDKRWQRPSQAHHRPARLGLG